MGYANINPFATLSAILEQLQQTHFDMLVVTGDISGDYTAQSYQYFYALLSQHIDLDKVRLIPGNHDDIQMMQQVLPDHLIKLNESEQHLGWQLNFLQTAFSGTLGRMTDSTLSWLQETMETSHSEHALLFMHHHPLDTGSFMDKHKLENKQDLMACLCTQKQNTVVAHGHIHHASDKMAQDVRVLSCPSTCWQWRMTPEFGITEEKPGYRNIVLTDNGMTTHVVRLQDLPL